MSRSTQIAAGPRGCPGGTPGRGADLAAAPAVLPQRPPGREVPPCHRRRAAVTGSRLPSSLAEGALVTGASCCHRLRRVSKAWGRWMVPPGSAAISTTYGGRLLVTQGHPPSPKKKEKKRGEHPPCCSSFAAGRCSLSAKQKEIAVLFQRFGSTAERGGDSKRSQVSSRELGGLRGLQLGTQQLLCYLPQRKNSPCFVNACGATWEASGRKWSPGLNALQSVVAREQKKQLGEHLLHTSEGKEVAEAEDRGLPL